MDISYSASPECQELIRALFSRFEYREDTNYAKIDRIKHKGIGKFKKHVLGMNYKGETISEWKRLMKDGNEDLLRAKLKELLE